MADRISQGNATYLRASAPGASSIEVELQAPQQAGGIGYGMGGYGYGYSYLDPLTLTRRRFFGWLCGAVVLAALAAVEHSALIMLIMPLFAVHIIRASYRHYWLLSGGYGDAISYLSTPSQWWPTDPDETARVGAVNADEKAFIEARRGSENGPVRVPRAPFSYRKARTIEAVRNAWHRVRQIPRRMACAVQGRPAPAPVGTLRLTHEPRATLSALNKTRRTRAK